MKKYIRIVLTVLAAAVLTTNSAYAVPFGADVIFVVDESGSMSGEHTWIGTMVTDLEAGLQTAGVTSNQYGLVGFGGGTGHLGGHTHLVGGADWGTAADLSTASGGLLINGSFEDGWDGIDFALNNYTFRAGAALNIILITDEDRDNYNASLSYQSVLDELNRNGALLNTVNNCYFAGVNTSRALGIDSKGNAYTADGSGGYNTETGGQVGSFCWGTTEADYVDMALATGGAAWDLNLLRVGGLTATSFTNAFVDIKVGEITRQDIPEPASLVLFSTGLIAVVAVKRRKKSSI